MTLTKKNQVSLDNEDLIKYKYIIIVNFLLLISNSFLFFNASSYYSVSTHFVWYICTI